MVSHVFPSSHYERRRREDIFQVSEKLHDRGHKVCVLTNKTFGAPTYEELGDIKIFRVPAYLIPTIRYPVTSVFSLLKTLKYIMNRFDIDVIHFWNVEHLTSLASVSKVVKKTPTIVSMEGLPGINWFYGVRIVDFCGLLYTATIGRFVLSSVSSVVVYGKSMIKYVSALGVSKDKIRVIAYGVDTKKFRPTNDGNKVRRRLGIKDSEKTILFVGRLEPVKGIDYLLETMFQLLKEFDDVKMLVVGDGSQRCKVERAAQKSKGKIIFTGYRRDIPEIMNVADVVVLPSLSEGLPLTVLEAQACGKPVVATSVGCVPDAIRNGVTGILVEPRSVSSLVTALSKVLRDDSLREKLSKNVVEYILNDYDWEHIIPMYEKLYGDLKRA